MAGTDLTEIQASLPVKVIGADSSAVETNPVNSSVQGDLFVKDVMNVAGVQGAVSLSTSVTEVRVGASRLTGRKSVTVCPTNGTIYFGFTNVVTTSTGTPIFKNQVRTFGIDDSHAIYIIASATTNVRITES